MERILVIGDIIIDNYLIGDTEKVSTEAPVPIVNITEERSVLGGAGNVVNNLLAFEANVDLISVIGNCNNVSILRELLKEKNIRSEYLVVENNRMVTKKTRIISSNQQIVRYDKEITKDIDKNSSDKILEIYKNIIKNYKIVVLSDYGKGVLTEDLTTKIIEIANKEGIKVLVDPKGSDYSKYTGAYLLTPNKKEASIATNITINNNNLLSAIYKLKSTYKLSISIITLSQEGIAVFDEELRIFPTQVKEVYDVTGAGDTVIAAIAHKLTQGCHIDDAIQFANLAAGIVVGKIGVATASIDEINNKQHHIKTGKEIKTIVDKLKQENKKIVFTNGCFDILHLGHIKYLERAKQLGDVLIVGVNSDQSVKTIKGENRPINPEYDRTYLLNALKSVDYTVLFNQSTPYELIKAIEPDVLVKGGDYENKEIVGSDLARTVKLIEFIEGKSTTEIINKIKQ
ncbi:D-glycero-beta-D-manno-heptose-7-phosphate kinase [Aquimarina sp. 2201CG14-23]|uniref:D-glycero-beta-D-manno-heptose-7-phosphate kinase n=1 Tax=Aquimarina mycalae TaxID=3040073 RepID=UPI002477FD18|nr:D-glycero-beta-D-manno-heptose-7-phosphate kinase [Aquimarina sp. 2201CG14-23]MDH7445149.1 D-glycero-beta-D-manno-heptose-7-phosphate kinase [Aquimarina sp. 2201CG14-23]